MNQSIYASSKTIGVPDSPIKPEHNINNLISERSLASYEKGMSDSGGIQVVTYLDRPELFYRLFASIKSEGELRVVCRYLAHYTKGINVPNLYVIIAEMFAILEDRLAEDLVDGGIVDDIISDKLDVLFPGSPEDKKKPSEEDGINERYEEYVRTKEVYKNAKALRCKVNKFIDKHASYL